MQIKLQDLDGSEKTVDISHWNDGDKMLILIVQPRHMSSLYDWIEMGKPNGLFVLTPDMVIGGSSNEIKYVQGKEKPIIINVDWVSLLEEQETWEEFTEIMMANFNWNDFEDLVGGEKDGDN